MENDFYGRIAFTAESETGGIKRIFRVLENRFDGRGVYSLFATTEYCGERLECFAYNVSNDEISAAKLCDYLCKEDVSAVSMIDVLNDLAHVGKLKR